MKKLTDKLCGPVQTGKRRHRGLRPFDPADAALLEAVSRGEFAISGFRNRDIRLALEGEMEDAVRPPPDLVSHQPQAFFTAGAWID